MKSFLITAILVSALPGAYAATLIDCNGNANQVNSCIAGRLPDFQGRLDWAVFGTPTGDPYQGSYTANNVIAGVGVTASAIGASDVFEGLRLGTNYAYMMYGGEWTLSAAVDGAPFSVAGHFDSQTDSHPATAVPPGDPGDSLLGVALNGNPMLNSADHGLVLNLSGPLDGVAFRVSSKSDVNFTVRVQMFTGPNLTGTALVDHTFDYSGTGGQCDGLFLTTSRFSPAPCNDAPFIGAMNTNRQIRSVLISTSDPNGFYIGDLFLASPTPEPAPMILSGCGLLGVLLWRRRSARRA